MKFMSPLIFVETKGEVKYMKVVFNKNYYSIALLPTLYLDRSPGIFEISLIFLMFELSFVYINRRKIYDEASKSLYGDMTKFGGDGCEKR